MSTPTPISSQPYTPEVYADEFRTAMGQVSTAYAGQAAALYTAWQAGKITTPEWQHLFTMSLLHSVADGTGIGDGMASRLLYLGHGHDVQPLGQGILDVPAEVARLSTAVDTLTTKTIDTAEDPRPRIARLAGSEPINAAQQAAVRVYDEHRVVGWRRGVRADACELCHWLAKTHLDPKGYVYPTSKPMFQHPGCTCVPIPVVRTFRTTA